MNPIPIHDWRLYLRDGEQFLQTARSAHRKNKAAFSTDTLYNLTCMAIEKLVMAFLMKRGDLAENHTMGDLARALEGHLDDAPGLYKRLAALDSFQEICDLDEYSIRTPSTDDIGWILAAGEEVRLHLLPHLEP
jgi:hypothetical protein